MSDPENLIDVIERWRTRGQEAKDCADELLTYYNDRFNRGDEEDIALVSDLALLEACDHRFGSLTLYGRGSVHLILEQLKSYVKEALPVPPQEHP